MQLLGGRDDDGADAPKQEGEMQRNGDKVDSSNEVADENGHATGDFQLGNANTPLKAIGETRCPDCSYFGYRCIWSHMHSCMWG